MPDTPETRRHDDPRIETRFTDETLLRVRRQVFEDADDLESADNFATLMDIHYQMPENNRGVAELLRLKRFARLATGFDLGEASPDAAYDFYTGELVALDVGYRMTGKTIFPSDEIQRFTYDILKQIPDYMDGVGKINRETLEYAPAPKNIGYQQRERMSQWGNAVYEKASSLISHGSLDLTPLHEIIIRLTASLPEEKARDVRAGFWLVMRNILTPSSEIEKLKIPKPEGAAFSRDETGVEDLSSLQDLLADHPEMDAPSKEWYYQNIDDLCTLVRYEHIRNRSKFAPTEDKDELSTQQDALEAQLTEMLETKIDLPIGSPIRVTGEYLLYSIIDGKIHVFYIPANATSELRGEFGGFSVKRARNQKSLDGYVESGLQVLPEEYDDLMPHIILNNAFEVNFDPNGSQIGKPVEATYDEPVEVPMLYKEVHFSTLTSED